MVQTNGAMLDGAVSSGFTDCRAVCQQDRPSMPSGAEPDVHRLFSLMVLYGQDSNFLQHEQMQSAILNADQI